MRAVRGYIGITKLVFVVKFAYMKMQQKKKWKKKIAKTMIINEMPLACIYLIG